MGKSKQKKTKKEIFDIDQYEFSTPKKKHHLKTQKKKNVVKSKKKETKKEKKAPNKITSKNTEAIDKLIMEDVANTESFLNSRITQKQSTNQGKKSTEYQTRSPVPAHSSHIVDLRKEYLIQKYNLHTIEKPAKKKRFKSLLLRLKQFNTHQKIEWHVPDSIKPQEKVIYSFQPIQAFKSKIVWQGNLTTTIIFSAILILIISPIPGLSLMSGALEYKNTLLTRGVSAFSAFKSGVDSLVQKDYQGADSQLNLAKQDFDEIYNNIDQFSFILTKVSSIVPDIKNKVELAKNISVIGSHTTEIIQLLSQKVSIDDESESISSFLSEISIHFSQIKSSLQESQDEILSLNAKDFNPELADMIIYLQDNIEDIIKDATKLEIILDLGQQILGGSGETSYLSILQDSRQERVVAGQLADLIEGKESKKYLLMFQNTRELRPTGGFMGSYALVEILDGRIINFDLPGEGTYSLSKKLDHHIIPPQPISILNREWHIWDANWWPDYPTSANKISWFYEQAHGEIIDGIITVNSDLMIKLFEEYGPIHLKDYEVTITAENFYDIIQKEVEIGYDKDSAKPKEILSDLYPILIEKIKTEGNYQEMISLITGALASRDIQIFLFNSSQQERVDALNWSNQIKSSQKDYLYVVSSNVAGGKSDHSIYQTIDHRAIIDDEGAVTVTVTITKEHQADPSDPLAYLTNLDYMRFYVPTNSILLSAYGFDSAPTDIMRQAFEHQTEDEYLQDISGQLKIDPASGVNISNELNHTVFANWLKIEPGETKSASITYRLPFSITINKSDKDLIEYWGSNYQEFDNYSLLMQKQSGKKNVIFNSTVVVPDRLHIIWDNATDPVYSGTNDNLYTFSRSLDSDIFYGVLLAEK